MRGAAECAAAGKLPAATIAPMSHNPDPTLHVIVPTALAYLLYARGLRLVSAAETATIGLVEPLTAAALGVTVLHERLRPATLAGAGLIVAGLLVLTLRLARRPRPVLSEA